MGSTTDQFTTEVAKVTGEGPHDGIDDRDVRDALVAFSRALDPGRSRPRLRKPRSDGTLVDVDLTPNTARDYLQRVRLTHERGFDLLAGTAEQYNDFMLDMCDGRLDDWNGSIQRTTAKLYQSAARAFYRFCDEPGQSADRPATAVEWPAEDIIIFTDTSEPRYDEADMFTDAEVDRLREACLGGLNPRRDRAFVELIAGTVQRIEVVRTLRVKDLNLDPDEGPPYILINPEIKNDGDKRAIETAGRWRPIVSDVAPIREFKAHHPLRDADVRAEYGCPDRFEECYFFVGDPNHATSDPSRAWNPGTIRGMLDRLGERAGVTKPVKPHNFRHWGYSKSKELPIDESVRRTVFSWTTGSDMGDEVYGHVETEQAGKQFAEAWAEAFDNGDGDIDTIGEQVVGDALGGGLSPEARQALARELLSDDAVVELIAEEVDNSA